MASTRTIIYGSSTKVPDISIRTCIVTDLSWRLAAYSLRTDEAPLGESLEQASPKLVPINACDLPSAGGAGGEPRFRSASKARIV